MTPARLTPAAVSATVTPAGRWAFGLTPRAFALLGMLNWTYQWYKASGSNSREEITRNFQDIFLRGILGNALAEEAAKASSGGR